MLQMQFNFNAIDDTTPVPEGNKVFGESKDEQTEFVPLWGHIRDNLKTMGRIKDSDVPTNMVGLW